MASKHEQFEAAFFSSTFHVHLFCFLIIIIVLNLAKRAKIKTNNLNLPPCPTKLPIIGNLHQLGKLPYHHSFTALSQKHGPLIMLQLGNTKTLVVSSADVAREIMKTHDIPFANRPQNTAIKALLYGGDDIAFAPYGERWTQKRKICVLELLSTKRVHSFGLIREQFVEEMISKILETRSNDACFVNLSELLIETINKINCKCFIGQNHCMEDCYNNVKELAMKMVTQISVVTVGDRFPLLGWVDVLTGHIKEFKATFGAMDVLLDQAIEEHKRMQREAEQCSSEKDFVDILIQLQEDGMPEFELTNNDIKSILMDMFVGGSGTTRATIEWAISELVKNPMKLKKVQEEVRRIVGHKSKLEENDINQMDYMKCVIKETIRLHPPAPLLAPRETSSSVKLRGFDIPAKTTVYINAWAIQRDPEFWERPEEFIPERHDNNKVHFQVQDFQFIPFGFGRRRCPGMKFALASVEYVLANLLYWFDWKLPATYTSAQDLDMSEVYGIVATRKTPLHLIPVPFSYESEF